MVFIYKQENDDDDSISSEAVWKFEEADLQGELDPLQLLSQEELLLILCFSECY